MTISKIAGESYRQISKAQLALHAFVHTQKYKLPAYIDEERFLCAVEVLRVLGDKLLALQPAHENLSFTVQTQLRHYMEIKKEQRPLTPQAEAEFKRYLAYSPVISNLVTSPGVTDISPYVKQVRSINGLQTLRACLPTQNNPSLTPATPAVEIARANVYVSAEQFVTLWAQLGGSYLTQQEQVYKNAFIQGKYLVLLPEQDLIKILLNPSFYNSLDVASRASSVQLLDAVYPLMSDEEKEKLLPLTNGPLRDKREEILNLPRKHRPTQNSLTDLFRLTDPKQFETALHTFCDLITKDQGELFFLTYDLTQVTADEFDTLDTVLDRLADSLRSYFEHQKHSEDDLWNYAQFRVMWLLLLIWFRKIFAASQTAAV